ncbi:MAG: hypothetical protein KatS3mg060_0965 [Dehalococcoidia bacterium]|nr:MAG: hypothetical protein KatS3mg060_0965 [Dehalococcoidia bacterium]
MTELVTVARTRGPRFWAPVALLTVLFLGFLLLPLPFLEKLRILSAGVCAQRPGHSIFFGDVQPPLESRMIGIYGGFFVAILALALAGRGKWTGMPSIPVMALALLFIAIMGFDGVNALFFDLRLPHAYPPQNWLRLVTGALCGLGIALLILPIFNFSVWRNGEYRAIVGLRGLAVLLLVEAAFVAIVLTGFWLLLYPVSVLSVAGVAGLLLAINLLIVLSILRREGQAMRPADLLGPGSLAMTLALAELLLLAGMRFWAEATLGITPL